MATSPPSALVTLEYNKDSMIYYASLWNEMLNLKYSFCAFVAENYGGNNTLKVFGLVHIVYKNNSLEVFFSIDLCIHFVFIALFLPYVILCHLILCVKIFTLIKKKL